MTLKIMTCSDNSLSHTGFGNIHKELLKTLYLIDDIEIAEFAFNGKESQKPYVPWQYYPVTPNPDTDEYKEYSKNLKNKQGAMRWEEACVHFKPNLVICLTDIWDADTMLLSPLKKNYQVLLYPTIDSDPLMAKYCGLLSNADHIVTMSNYAKEVIEATDNPVLNMIPPGFDQVKISQEECRKTLGIPQDAIIYGTVCRNQPRKKLVELIEAFGSFYQETNENVYLYLHTGIIDISSWDLGDPLIRSKCAHRILFTYKFNDTQKYIARTFADHKLYTDSKTAYVCGSMGNYINNISLIYGSFDYYIQCASCEGFGLPIAQAAAHGIPSIAIDYSAMSEVCKNTGGKIISPDAFPYEVGPSSKRAAIPIYKLVEAFHHPSIQSNHYYTLDKFKESWQNLIKSIKDDIPNLWHSAPTRFTDLNKEKNVSLATYVNYAEENPLLATELLYKTYIEQMPHEELLKLCNSRKNSQQTLEKIRLGNTKQKIKDWMK